MLTGLSDNQIVKLLAAGSSWGKRAIREIIRRKNDFIPPLLEILDYTHEHPEKADYDRDALHIPAAYLLAQFREPLAYPKLIRLINIDEDREDLLWGNIVCESFRSILRDTYNGDSGLLRSLLENRFCSPWVKTVAVDAYAMLSYDNYIKREDLVGYFRYLIQETRSPNPSPDDVVLFSFLMSAVADHHLTEMREDIKILFDEDFIDRTLIYKDYEEFSQALDRFEDEIKDIHIVDTIRELETWSWFPRKKSYNNDYDRDDFPEVGRNDPCPCGSGKKYKKCCLYNE